MAVDQFQNAYVTKLRTSCTAEADVIFVDEPPTITQGILTIEFANQTKREIIHFTGVEGYKLTGVTRGYEDTTPTSHSVGADIRQNVTASMLDHNNIHTNMIVDHAVTREKIDMSTINQGYNWEFIGRATMESDGHSLRINFDCEKYRHIKIIVGGEFGPTERSGQSCSVYPLDINGSVIPSSIHEHWSWDAQAGQGTTSDRGIAFVNTGNTWDTFMFEIASIRPSSGNFRLFLAHSGRFGGSGHQWNTVARTRNNAMVKGILFDSAHTVQKGCFMEIWGVPMTPEEE